MSATQPEGLETRKLLRKAAARFAFLKPSVASEATLFGPADLEFEEALVATIKVLLSRETPDERQAQIVAAARAKAERFAQLHDYEGGGE